MSHEQNYEAWIQEVQMMHESEEKSNSLATFYYTTEMSTSLRSSPTMKRLTILLLTGGFFVASGTSGS